jgi:hypothetical protein
MIYYSHFTHYPSLLLLLYGVGGMKVNGFLYSESFPTSLRGSNYSHLMHVSDWLPTILSLAEISNSATSVVTSSLGIDGIDHAAALLKASDSPSTSTPAPRELLLYNILYNVSTKSFNISYNAPFAIRNSRYKLIHEYSDNTVSAWMSIPGHISHNNSIDTDDDLSRFETASCTPGLSLTGKYDKMLFDLATDPYETMNQYDNPEFEDVKVIIVIVFIHYLYSSMSYILFVFLIYDQ